ncbi:DNA repair protein RecO [Limibacterium fermenti]|uniref:DNA repair protein RecO n=1 Tax=Limibacterium fermenti TaxID=3229863 RepID=UPI000E82C8BC|nr:DNA repair protein RecO [Porphyromonadaceae bacterium]
MLFKTQGIVLGTSKYSDTYSISQVFTRDFGRVSYLVPKRGRKSKIKASLFYPLSMLDMQVEHVPLRDIQRLKEVECRLPVYEGDTDMTKWSISFFLSEFLSRVLRETGRDEWLFTYLENSVETLHAASHGVANFHLAFLFGLSRCMGIYPNMDTYRTGAYFDLLNGEFVQKQPLHPHYLSKSLSADLTLIRRINYANMHLFRLSKNDRNTIIDYLLAYYRLHLYDFPPLKSLEVLREMF